MYLGLMRFTITITGILAFSVQADWIRAGANTLLHDESEVTSLYPSGRGIPVPPGEVKTGDTERFLNELDAIGISKDKCLLREPYKPVSYVRIPGGISALLHLIGWYQETTDDEFLKTYSKIVLSLGNSSDQEKSLKRRVREYFRLLRDLEDLGARDGDDLEIRLSLSDVSAENKTDTALKLLGWRRRDRTVIELSVESSAAQRQRLSSILSFDGLQMQDCLRANGDYVLRIVDSWVPVVPDDTIWRDLFFKDRNFGGGFAQALVEDQDLAKLYLGVSRLSEETKGVFIKDLGLNTLHDKWVDALYRNAESLVVHKGTVLVPGGKKSESYWERLIEAEPSTPGLFFQNLFQIDNGKMLDFFSLLMQIDPERQKFFNASSERILQFYNLYKNSPGIKFLHQRTKSFLDLISRIPMDSNGHVRFPGGPEVWMVAAGQSDSMDETVRLLEIIERVASAESEVEVLNHLVKTEYPFNGEIFSESANYLAVSHLESHRSSPLDKATALLLAQEYPYHRSIWPYLTGMTRMDFEDYIQVFQLRTIFESFDAVTLNDVLGEFHSVAKILCMMQDFQNITPDQAAMLFRSYNEELARADSMRDIAEASLKMVRDLLKISVMEGSDPDKAICNLLLQQQGSNTREETKFFDSKRERQNSYWNVLDLQRVPSLRVLFAILRTVENLEEGRGDSLRELERLETYLDALPEIDYEICSRLSDKAGKSVDRFKTDRLRDLVRRMRKVVSEENPNQREMGELTQSFMGTMNPQIRLALTGIVYAYYFRFQDMVILGDESFLRRHQFIGLDGALDDNTVYQTAKLISDSYTGSYLTGGFANFGYIASKTSIATNRKYNVSTATAFYAASVLSSLRDTDWTALRENELKIVELRIRAGREWIHRAAFEKEQFSALDSATKGILAAGRRISLLDSIECKDWNSIWDMVSIGDLYNLGERYTHHFDNTFDMSPTVAALQAYNREDELPLLAWLGPELNDIYECGRLHSDLLPPCEYYKNYMFPEKMAERCNEFKLHLAEIFCRFGIASGFLEREAEPLMIKTFSGLQLTGPMDWQSVMKAYDGMEKEFIEDLTRYR